MSHILTLTTFAPTIGALAILLLRFAAGKGGEEAAGKGALWVALATTLATFALSVVMIADFDTRLTGFQFVEDQPWFSVVHYLSLIHI